MSDNPFIEHSDDYEIPEFDEPKKNEKISSQKDSFDPNSSKAPNHLSPEKKAKWEALKAKEAELLAKKKKIEDQVNEMIPSPNYPTFFPLIHYDVQNDLPQASHKCVNYCLKMLMYLSIASIFNVFTVLLVTGLPYYSKVRCFIFAIIQGTAAIYLALNYSYNYLYSSCRKKDIPFKWTIFQFILIVWCAYISIGFPTSGSVGFATFLDLLASSKSSTFSKMFAFINTTLAITSTAFGLFTLSETQKYQKVSGQDDDSLLNQEHV